MAESCVQKGSERWPEIVEGYLMTGQRDYLLRIVVKDLETYEKLLKGNQAGWRSPIESSFALGQVKHAQELPSD